MSQSEHNLQSEIRLALGKLPNVRIFRNVTAQGWGGKLIRINPDGSALIANARPIHAGLHIGSADLIGWVSTPTYFLRGLPPGEAMPTKPDGYACRFLSLEVKTPTGRPTIDQLNWQAQVRAAGGIAEIARSVDEALRAVT